MHDDDTRQPDMVTHLQRFADAVDPLHRHRGDSENDSADNTRYTAEEVEAIRDVWRRRAITAQDEMIEMTIQRNALIRYARALEQLVHDVYEAEIDPDGEPESPRTINRLRAEHGVAALLEDA